MDEAPGRPRSDCWKQTVVLLRMLHKSYCRDQEDSSSAVMKTMMRLKRPAGECARAASFTGNCIRISEGDNDRMPQMGGLTAHFDVVSSDQSWDATFATLMRVSNFVTRTCGSWDHFSNDWSRTVSGDNVGLAPTHTSLQPAA